MPSAPMNKAMPTIVFESKDATGSDVSTVRVAMDGEVIAERLGGTALSIDPGDHEFSFEAPGHDIIKRRFVVYENEKARRERVVFGVPDPVPPPIPEPGGMRLSRWNRVGSSRPASS